LLAGLLGSAPSWAYLEEHECRLEIEALPAVFAQCATLSVPVDFDAPAGATLSLSVARIPALTATPAPDPLLLINGGPGGSGIDLYVQMRAAFLPVRRDRDIILVDQRGTGRSRAGLTCEIPPELELETAEPGALADVVEGCLSEFDNDPRFFTTSSAVRDLEALRAALGADRWNIYGVSYGTRVAQHYLRRYPERVRALILDGVVPPDVALGPDVAGNAEAALARVFARCAADTDCERRFGELREKFTRLRRRLSVEPVTVELPDPLTAAVQTGEIAEVDLQAVVRLMSYSAPTIALLPLVIDEALAGNYVPLAAHADILIESLAESLSFAMHNSVVCTEDVPFFSSDGAAPVEQTYLGSAVVDGLVAICKSWPVGVRDPDLKTPVVSDRPALLLSGELDPVTPPEYAERVIDGGLTNARHLIGRGQGHGIAAIGCVPRLMRDFLTDLAPTDLRADCIDKEVPVPFFLGFQGPAP
jgi:pimeloyl-ACP methyl ester carboxylesterase